MIGFHCETLCTVDNVLSHADFHAILDQVVIEAPRVELLLAMQLVPVALLKDLDAPLLWHGLKLLFDFSVEHELLQEHPLVMEVHIQLEHVVPSQLLDKQLILLGLIEDPHDFRPSPPVKSFPQFLYLANPHLVGLMRRLLCILGSLLWPEMLESCLFH